MENWRDTIINPGDSILDAIKVLDKSAAQICLVSNSTGHLLGTVTDGDIRRAVLRSISMESPVESIMNISPRVATISEGRRERLKRMTALSIHQMPLVESDGRIIGLETLDELMTEENLYDNWVVLMAGGLGKRLRPYTSETPKPLLNVGGKPILETILERFIAQGFRNFYMSVNYRRDMIKSYFADGSRWNVKINYLDEGEALGTAGSLRLLQTPPTSPIIVMNGDVLTHVNFESLLAFHRETGADVTMAVREYDFEVPFGVVDLLGGRIKGIVEKPVHKFLVNAGIYAIDPAVLKHINSAGPFDMPDFFRALIELGYSAQAFPVREYWLDIGRESDLYKAREEFEQQFDDGSRSMSNLSDKTLGGK